jgi:hypothetical protein
MAFTHSNPGKLPSINSSVHSHGCEVSVLKEGNTANKYLFYATERKPASSILILVG